MANIIKSVQTKLGKSSPVTPMSSEDTSAKTFKQFETGAVRDRQEGKGRYVYIPPVALKRYALRCEYGEKKYGDGRNWEKGMPLGYYIDSAIRHINDYNGGDNSEDHLAAAMWNLGAAMDTEEQHPEFIDIPSRQGKKWQDSIGGQIK